MAHSHIMYCINIYSCANVSSLNKLKVKQKEAIRIICKVGFREHIAPLFVQLKILPLEELIKVNCLKFMHSFVLCGFMDIVVYITLFTWYGQKILFYTVLTVAVSDLHYSTLCLQRHGESCVLEVLESTRAKVL
jgi:hypothetical protein